MAIPALEQEEVDVITQDEQGNVTEVQVCHHEAVDIITQDEQGNVTDVQIADALVNEDGEVIDVATLDDITARDSGALSAQ